MPDETKDPACDTIASGKADTGISDTTEEDTILFRPPRTVWDEPTPPSEEWIAARWFPMVTCPGGPVLRPHILHGPMVGEVFDGKVHVAGNNMWFPPEAFEPYWMPVPQMPWRKKQ